MGVKKAKTDMYGGSAQISPECQLWAFHPFMALLHLPAQSLWVHTRHLYSAIFPGHRILMLSAMQALCFPTFPSPG